MSLPEFIDTASCLCGLLSAPAAARNGEQVQMWRCIGNAAANITVDTTGKWFNTSLPSQELSGINEPQNWGDNPPDLSSAYVLVDSHGTESFQNYTSGSSPELIGNDIKCTGKNDTVLSGNFYKDGAHALPSASSGTMSSSTMQTPSPSASRASMTSSASTTSGAGATPSAASSSSAPSVTASSTTAPTSSMAAHSSASHVKVKTLLIFGVMLAPLVSFST